MAEPLECSRNATGSEVRHLRVIGQEQPLCGSKARQSGAGAGRWSGLLHWPTCRPCVKRAKAMGPASSQRDDAPVTFRKAQLELPV